MTKETTSKRYESQLHTHLEKECYSDSSVDEISQEAPNGGYGWVIVMIAFACNFSMFSVTSIWGVYMYGFATTVLKDKATRVELVGVGSTALGMMNLLAPIGSYLLRYGERRIMFCGSILLWAGVSSLGFATEIWHLYLSIGVLFAFGLSLVYTTTTNLVAQWFSTKRATALGISSCGTGVGGLVMSPIISMLTAKLGIQWTCYISGFVVLAICSFSSFFARPTSSKGHCRTGAFFKWSLLKNSNFIIALIGLVASSSVFLIPLFLLADYSIEHNISTTNTSIIVGVSLGCSSIGRIIIGFAASRYGRLDAFIVSSILSAAFCALVWPFAKSFWSIMLFGILFGLTGSIYYALAAAIVVEIVGIEDGPYGISLLFLFNSVSGAVTPLATIFIQHAPKEGFIAIQMLSGALYLVAGLLCLVLKLKMSKS